MKNPVAVSPAILKKAKGVYNDNALSAMATEQRQRRRRGDTHGSAPLISLMLFG